jgi:NAD(P)H-dependent flavin oxidoreductase YrpB (nitropropane dioxygenase family)
MAEKKPTKNVAPKKSSSAKTVVAKSVDGYYCSLISQSWTLQAGPFAKEKDAQKALDALVKEHC